MGRCRPCVCSRSDTGAGDRDLPGTPNVLRVVIGDDGGTSSLQRVVVIESEIDDMNPQIFGVLMDRLYAVGALDVFYAPVQMKKNRPGTLVSVVALPEQREALSEVLFRETTTLGVRFREMDRERLEREELTVDTPLGPISVQSRASPRCRGQCRPRVRRLCACGRGEGVVGQRGAGGRHEGILGQSIVDRQHE